MGIARHPVGIARLPVGIARLPVGIARHSERITCHPERSEGSQALGGTRSFATLRMTEWLVRMTAGLLS